MDSDNNNNDFSVLSWFGSSMLVTTKDGDDDAIPHDHCTFAIEHFDGNKQTLANDETSNSSSCGAVEENRSKTFEHETKHRVHALPLFRSS
mmetsp:Transcript_25168/g.38936  ORF Transcript_25168/g.38936 Transcript_25168/m.38936 type:complete len:91 (-) Transcript_25168:284-556(-)